MNFFLTVAGPLLKDEMRIVLLGKTGNGKSSTGNTILGAGYFEAIKALQSITKSCQKEFAVRFQRKVVIIDTPGVFDTSKSKDVIKMEIADCVNLSVPGVHAFLLVIKFERFTTEERDSILRLADMFGAGMLRYAIIVVTHSEGISRDEFIEQADNIPGLSEIMRQCDSRFILIDNSLPARSKDKIARELICAVDKMIAKNDGNIYTNEMYKEAERAIAEKEKERLRRLQEKKKKEKEEIEANVSKTFNRQIESLKQEAAQRDANTVEESRQNHEMQMKLIENADKERQNLNQQHQNQFEKINKELERVQAEAAAAQKAQAEATAAQKKQAEAAIQKAHSEAAVQKAQAEAATAQKAQADAAVQKAHSDAAVQKAQTEAATAVQKARTEAATAVQKAHSEAAAAVQKAQAAAAVQKAQVEAAAAKKAQADAAAAAKKVYLAKQH